MQVSVAITHQTPSHSPYSDRITIVNLRGVGVRCILAVIVLPSPSSAVLSPPSTGGERTAQQQYKPTSKRAPNNSENEHSHFIWVTSVLVHFPFLRDLARREAKLITNSLGWVFFVCLFFFYIIILDTRRYVMMQKQDLPGWSLRWGRQPSRMAYAYMI